VPVEAEHVRPPAQSQFGQFGQGAELPAGVDQGSSVAGQIPQV
jgi:hypothetical protein